MKAYYEDESVTLYHGDALDTLRTLPDGSVNCCVTSPPYFGLRDYGSEGQYGLEETPTAYVETMRALFGELRRVLADDGTLWLNLGDSYNSPPVGSFNGGSKFLAGRDLSGHATSGSFDKFKASGLPSKNLMGIPWRVAFALQADGWRLRNEIIWHKTASMPDSARDRFSRKHEHLFLLTRSDSYWFDLNSVKNDAGANPGDVWTLAPQPLPEAHFAVMPAELARRAVLAGCKPGGVVLDPFSGSGTTGLVAGQTGRRYLGIDIRRDYLDLSLRTRLAQSAFDFDATA